MVKINDTLKNIHKNQCKKSIVTEACVITLDLATALQIPSKVMGNKGKDHQLDKIIL